MINKTTASARGAACGPQAAWRTRGGVWKWMRLAPLVLAVLWAAGAIVAAPDYVLAQDVLAQDDVLDYVESQFGGYGLQQASAVVISPDDKFLYVVSEQDDAVAAFSRDITTGELTYIATYVNGENNVTGLNDPVDIAVSPDGRNLYVIGDDVDLLARQINGTVVVFTRDITTGQLTYVETEVNGVGNVTNMLDTDAVNVSPDGLNVYVAGDTALTVFRRQPNNDGKLRFVESEQGAGNGVPFQLRDVVVSPDNSTIYVTSYLENAVAVLDRDAGDDGKVTVAQVLRDGVGGVDGLFLAEKLSVSPDGANVYATGAISPTGLVSGTVVVFDRSGDGTLAYAETLVNGSGGVDGIAGARSVEASADGKNVYVAGATGNSLAVFARNGAGKLSFAECFTANDSSPTCQTDVPGLKNPSDIAVSADGEFVYPTGRESNAVSIFARDTGAGGLTFEDVVYNSDGGVPGLGGADDVDVSPDGKNVYVSAGRDNAVVVFQRDSGAMGKLNFVEAEKEGEGGVTGLVDPSSVTVSPDGKHVYATGFEPGSVVVFERDAVTGTLAYVETKLSTGADGLVGAWQAALSPDGASLYVTGITSGTVAVFSRAADTGKLTGIQTLMNGANGVSGLRGATGIATSPDGKDVYVTGADDDSVVAFRRNESTGKLQFVEAYSGPRGLNGAISVDVTADGKNVYVASVVEGLLAVFNRDANTGRLSYQGAIAEAEPPEQVAPAVVAAAYWSVDAAPDGKHVFVASWQQPTLGQDPVGAVVVYAREPNSGLLSRAQVLKNDEGGVRGLRTPESLVVSPDNANVYVTSSRDSATVVFEVVGSAPFSDVNFLPFMSAE